LKVKLLGGEAPTQAYDNAAGYDLYASRVVILAPGSLGIVKTGIAVEIPVGFVGLIRDRSSYGVRGIIHTAGVIDSDYRGEVKVCLWNTTDKFHHVQVGDKIAQMVIVPHYSGKPTVVNELSETSRGQKGFGSSDVSTQ
jgi:dUTP pyrophosphatase